MQHPERWRETVDPYALPYRSFELKEVLGYPHAGNDVFHARGICEQCGEACEVEVYIKVARQDGADIRNEIETIRRLGWTLAPQVIDCDEEEQRFVVTLARRGERLSTLVGDNRDGASLGYMFEYGQTLARLHAVQGEFAPVKDRRFFHIPDSAYFERENLAFVREYLVANRPLRIDRCFCHGDFHYANLLWEAGHISAILDFELSGIGCREFDIAWALVRRPGQKFMNTREEIELFLHGYASAGTCSRESVEYYMVLIYTYFYSIGRDTPGYQAYVMDVFRACCKA